MANEKQCRSGNEIQKASSSIIQIQEINIDDTDAANPRLIVQADRVLKILDSMLEKVEIGLILPNLIKNKSLLNKFLSSGQLQRLLKICSKYIENEVDLITHDGEVIMIDHRLMQAIEILHKNSILRGNIPEYLQHIPERGKRFLNLLQELEHFVGIHLKTTASTDINREKFLHRIWHENENVKLKIKDLKTQLHEKEITMQWKISEKQALIKKYKMDLSDKKWKNNILIQKEVANANKKMMAISKLGNERKSKLEKEVSKLEESYKYLLTKNILRQKTLREKRDRISNRLQEWIKKYDTDVGQRTNDINRLTQDLKARTEKMNKFMIGFNIQEKEYLRVIVAREAEEKLAQQQKMLIFMMNRAARTIQEAWRRFLQKRKKKGKAKAKGKGKKVKK